MRACHRVAVMAVLAGSLAAGGCDDEVGDPLPQWLVTISTDAPVPQFGDVLLVEVLSADGTVCSSCRRLFSVGELGSWPVSLGVMPVEGQPPGRVRARLYRAAVTGLDGSPVGEAYIDRSGALPGADGLTEVWLELPMSCFGVPAVVGRALSCDPATAELVDERVLPPTPALEALPAVGSWLPAQRVPCAAPAPQDMVCVEGGAFLLGGHHFVPAPTELIYEPLPERLVQLSPYALDRDEVTVGTVRSLVSHGAIASEPFTPGSGAQLDCTYLGVESDDNDLLPANCLGHDLARDICVALGKRLPTEAEWEFAAINGPAETIFPWGDDDDACAYAHVGRGHDFSTAQSTHCVDALGVPAGLVAGGSDADQTQIGIRNLAGSVAEWTADAYLSYTDPCWSSARLLLDPACPIGAGPRMSVRGAAWLYVPALTRSIQRNGIEREVAGHGTGVRCAVSLGP